jgi:hypothetical protein
MEIQFYKYQGTGNDFIILDNRSLQYDGLTEHQINKMCNRRFGIGADGLIETQRISDTTLRNATVEGCILQKVAKWKFPTPQGGTKVLVTYPFLFKSTN